ncbi:MAG: hypothetical protein ABSC55_18355 [Syntrophorhabdales bacterium]|jgi:hypothetical protein
MFGYKHYVPILKGKEGEFRALALLAPSVRRKITPFIDVPRVDIDIRTNKPKDPIHVYLEKKVEKIRKFWGTDQELFVDVFDLDLNLRTPKGSHFLEFLFSQLRANSIRAIPVIGLDRSTNTAYVDAVSWGLCCGQLRR